MAFGSSSRDAGEGILRGDSKVPNHLIRSGALSSPTQPSNEPISVARRKETDEEVECSGVGANDDTILSALEPFQDLLRAYFGGESSQMLFEVGDELLGGDAEGTVAAGATVPDEMGLHAARENGRNGDGKPLEPKFEFEAFGEAADGEFGGDIATRTGPSDEAEGARNGGNVSAARADQLRQERLGRMYDTPEVDVEEPSQIDGIHFEDGYMQVHPSAVDEDVCRAECALDVLGPGQHLGSVRDIHGGGVEDRLREVGAAGRDVLVAPGFERFESARVEVEGGDARAARQAGAGQSETNPSCGTSDGDHASSPRC